MGEHSKIEWTDHTFNPWWGCTKVSPACDNCYAEAWARRTGHNVWGAKSNRRLLSDANWKQPYKWNRAAALEDRRKRVFCASMADVFEWKAGLVSLRERLWDTIEGTPSLDWLLLTKRPHLIMRLAPWGNDWPDNVWVGTTVENQKFAAKRIHYLLNVPAKVRFLSCEPLLEQIDLAPWLKDIQWVIAGGETGGKARKSHPDWFRILREQCQEFGTAFHFKQWGDWFPVEEAKHTQEIEFVRLGKKRSGRILDHRSWDELPHVESGSR